MMFQAFTENAFEPKCSVQPESTLVTPFIHICTNLYHKIRFYVDTWNIFLKVIQVNYGVITSSSVKKRFMESYVKKYKLIS